MATYTRASWGAAPATGRYRMSRSLVRGLAFHWPGMATPKRSVPAVKRALRSWQRYHQGTRGWSDIAYQVAVDQWGNRYTLRGLRWRSGANGNLVLNVRYGAVLLVLAPGEEPSPAMIRECRALVAEHRAMYPRSKRIVGHGDIRPGGTVCPGPNVQALIDAGAFEPEDDMPYLDWPAKDRKALAKDVADAIMAAQINYWGPDGGTPVYRKMTLRTFLKRLGRKTDVV